MKFHAGCRRHEIGAFAYLRHMPGWISCFPKRIAFEIETGRSDAAANVRKCLEGGMDQVVAVGAPGWQKGRSRVA